MYLKKKTNFFFFLFSLILVWNHVGEPEAAGLACLPAQSCTWEQGSKALLHQCCPFPIHRASLESLALAIACQIKAIAAFHVTWCANFLSKPRSNPLISFRFNSFVPVMALKHRDKKCYHLVRPSANFSLNKDFNRACKQGCAFLSLHENCGASIGSLEFASILSPVTERAGAVTLSHNHISGANFWGSGSVSPRSQVLPEAIDHCWRHSNSLSDCGRIILTFSAVQRQAFAEVSSAVEKYVLLLQICFQMHFLLLMRK